MRLSSQRPPFQLRAPRCGCLTPRLGNAFQQSRAWEIPRTEEPGELQFMGSQGSDTTEPPPPPPEQGTCSLARVLFARALT